MQEILLPQSVLTEAAYLLTSFVGNQRTARFLASLPKSKYSLIALQPEEIARTAELLAQYADAKLDFVDATVAALAERLNITHVLTIDRRDFSIIRPRHAAYFELLPEKL
jgi:uncharacterized protein